jgi:hypothetical protein
VPLPEPSSASGTRQHGTTMRECSLFALLTPRQVHFMEAYPMTAPTVEFGRPSPAHPHIYSNGALLSEREGVCASVPAHSLSARPHMPGHPLRRWDLEPGTYRAERLQVSQLHACLLSQQDSSGWRRGLREPRRERCECLVRAAPFPNSPSSCSLFPQHALDLPRRQSVSACACSTPASPA